MKAMTTQVEHLLEELIQEVRGLRQTIEQRAQVVSVESPAEDALLTLTELERYAGAKRSTLESYVKRKHDPLPHLRRPKDGAYQVRWGDYKAWLARQQAGRADEAEAREALISLVSGGRR